MGRKRKLSEEQIAQIKANVERKTLKQWALFMDVSIVTIIHAKKGTFAYSPARQEA